MKVYKKENAIIVQNEGTLYCLEGQNWDEYINDDQLFQKLKASIGNAKTINVDQLDGLNPPIDSQELWASGVTYYMSKKGREEESKETGGSIFYTKVYEADRPELFFKATKNRISGTGEAVRIRRDSSWNVPEPELTLFVTSNAKIVGYSIGNDMSSRDIEGQNPLYLPQAKTYDGCASLGPCIYVPEKPMDQPLKIELTIERQGTVIFQESISTDRMKRKPQELVDYLFRESSFPDGAFLMTGTGIVPPADFTLALSDVVSIEIEKIGTLTNPVA
ncbi:MAG: fumarylacetoacetate hydrolase family protein [Flavobacteriaceae bacterium]